jgi:predicted nucleotidyltransferase
MSEKPDILLFLSKNKERLKKKYHLTRIGVFGSVVRNDFSDDSDIDIIVEFEENTPDLYSIKLNIKKEPENCRIYMWITENNLTDQTKYGLWTAGTNPIAPRT